MIYLAKILVSFKSKAGQVNKAISGQPKAYALSFRLNFCYIWSENFKGAAEGKNLEKESPRHEQNRGAN